MKALFNLLPQTRRAKEAAATPARQPQKSEERGGTTKETSQPSDSKVMTKTRELRTKGSEERRHNADKDDVKR